MNVEIKVERINTRWHARIAERPDLEEIGLTEQAARAKMEQLVEALGRCGAKAQGDAAACELVRGHHVRRSNYVEHRGGGRTWRDAAVAKM